MRTKSFAAYLVVCLFLAACGDGEGEEEGSSFPDLESGNLAAEAWDWVVEGMSCDGEEVVRFVGLVEEESDEGEVERKARYFRGDDCVDAGDLFWDRLPDADGDTVSVLVDSETQEEQVFAVASAGDHVLRLEGDEEIRMRKVERATHPTAIPDLDDFDLAGEWWMEDYPCTEELVPQLVRVVHPPGNLHVSKIVGDECVDDGESFLDASLNGTSISGTTWVVEQPDFFDEEDVEGKVEVTGTVRTEDFIRLAVMGHGVSLRRVKGE